MFPGIKNGDNTGQKAPESGVTAEIKALGADIAKTHDQFKEDLAKLKADSGSTHKDFEKFKTDLDVKFGDYNAKMTSFGETLKEVELKQARGGSPDTSGGVKSAGQQFVESEQFKAMQRAPGQNARVKIKGSIVGEKAITSLGASAGAMVRPDRLPGVINLPDRRMTIRSLLAAGRTSVNSVEYIREKTFTNNADMQTAEGVKKAESSLTYEAEDAKVRTIAHFIKASTQILDDGEGLASMIDARLRYGLAYKEELQILKGDGTGANLEGLITAATEFANPAGLRFTPTTHLDILRLAALQCTVAEYAADGFVLNPIDWALIELAKDTQGRYIIGQPQGAIGASMWNLPVVASTAMDVDEFLTGAFGLAAQIFDRQDATVDVSTENVDDFEKNLVTIRAEGRLALAIYRTDALITGDFDAILNPE